jgi:hypothetical protein
MAHRVRHIARGTAIEEGLLANGPPGKASCDIPRYSVSIRSMFGEGEGRLELGPGMHLHIYNSRTRRRL